MPTLLHSATVTTRKQFGLITLMELIALCSILFALAEFTGVPSSIFLAMMVFALMARRGLLTIVLMATAMIAGERTFGVGVYGEFLQPLGILLIGGALCVWFRVRPRPGLRPGRVYKLNAPAHLRAGPVARARLTRLHCSGR
jgi:hypothetical protein